MVSFLSLFLNKEIDVKKTLCALFLLFCSSVYADYIPESSTASSAAMDLDMESDLTNEEMISEAALASSAVICYSGRDCTGEYLGLMFLIQCRNSGKSYSRDGSGSCHNF